jgi:hypothetical protein
MHRASPAVQDPTLKNARQIPLPAATVDKHHFCQPSNAASGWFSGQPSDVCGFDHPATLAAHVTADLWARLGKIKPNMLNT